MAKNITASQFSYERQRIQSSVDYWQYQMDLDSVKINNLFYKSKSDDIARVEPTWEYRRATIQWFMRNTIELDQSELDEAVTHELTHIIVAPMADFLPEEHIKLEEFVVEGLSRIILKIKRGEL